MVGKSKGSTHDLGVVKKGTGTFRTGHREMVGESTETFMTYGIGWGSYRDIWDIGKWLGRHGNIKDLREFLGRP